MDIKTKLLSVLITLLLVASIFSTAAVFSGSGTEEEKKMSSTDAQREDVDIGTPFPGIEKERDDEETGISVERQHDDELHSSGFVLQEDEAWSNATKSGNPFMNFYGSMGSAVGYEDLTGNGELELVTGSTDFNSDLTDPINQRSLRVWVYDEETEGLELVTEKIPEDLSTISAITTGPSGSGYIVTGGQDETEPPQEHADLRLWGYDGSSISLLDTQQWMDDGYNNTINSVAVTDIDSDGGLEVVTVGLNRFDEDEEKSEAQLTIWTIEDNSTLSLKVKEEWVENEKSGADALQIEDLAGDDANQIITGGWADEDNSEIIVWEWDGDGNITQIDSEIWTEGQSGIVAMDTADLTDDGKPEIITSGGNEQMDGTAAEIAVVSYDETGLEVLARERFFVNPEDFEGDTIGVSVDVVDGDLDGELDILVSGLTEGPHPGGTTFWGIMMACSYSNGELTKDAENYWLEDDETAVFDHIVADFMGDSHAEITQIGYKAWTSDDGTERESHARIWMWNYLTEANTYTLTIESTDGGTTDPSPGSHTYNEGENVTVKALPEDGWYFEEWTGDVPPGEEDQEEITITMDEDKSLTAHFEREFFFEVDIVEYDKQVVEGDPVSVDYTVENTGVEEDTQTIEFLVDGVVEESSDVTLGAGEIHDGNFTWQTEVGDAGEHNLTVASEDDQEEVTVNVMEEGIFSVMIIGYDQEVREGQEAAVDYSVVNTGEEEDTQVIEFTVDGALEDSKEVTLAGEEEHQDTFTWQTEEGDAGEHNLRVASEDDDDGVTVNVTALEDPFFEVEITSPAEGAEYTQGETVTVDHTVTNIGEEEDTQTIEFRVDGDLKDTAEVNLGPGEEHQGEFAWEADELDEHILSVETNNDQDEVTVMVVEDIIEYELSISLEGEGTTEPGPGVHTYEEGAEETVTALPDDGWGFSRWEGDVPEGEEGSEEITITMDSDKEVTAYFEEEGVHELTIESTEGGEVIEPGEGTFEYEEGETVELEAVPDEDYEFVEWMGDDAPIGDPTLNRTTITIEADHTITAEFQEEVAEYYNLTVDVEGEGMIYFEPEEEEYEEDTEVTIEAIPAEGYEFVEWRGDHEDTEEEITITMDSDKVITAYFAQKPSFEIEITSPEDGKEFEKGEEVDVIYEIENTGDLEGERDIEFYVDGELVETKESVSIEPDGTHDGYFTWEAEEEGDVELLVRSVSDEGTLESEASVNVAVADSISYWWIVLPLLAVVAVIAALLLIKRKRDEKEDTEGERQERKETPRDQL
ncbi:MAG: InlB B-repeat-containing protein [Candidatus Natronoplasma sp.]